MADTAEEKAGYANKTNMQKQKPRENIISKRKIGFVSKSSVPVLITYTKNTKQLR
mgnify:CR=1 FL=1